MLRSVFFGCALLCASVGCVLVGAESQSEKLSLKDRMCVHVLRTGLVRAEHQSRSYNPSLYGNVYVTCVITHSPLMTSETIYIPINMAGGCLMTPNSATLGGFRVKTIGSNKRFEIHVYNHDKIELRKINASVEEESERSGATSVQNIQKDESIEITYSFTDNRSEEQKREDAEDTAE